MNLPVEIRLLIYEYAIDSGSITISSAPVQAIGSKDRAGIPGLPENHSPIVRARYDKILLRPFVRAEDCAYEFLERPNTPQIDPTLPSLRLACHQVRHEIQDVVDKGSVDLYLSWPNGVCVLMYDRKLKQLLRQCRTVYITGVFSLDWRKQTRRTSLRPGLSTTSKISDGGGVPVQIKQLQRLVSMLLGPNPSYSTPSTPDSTFNATLPATLPSSFGSTASPYADFYIPKSLIPLSKLTIRNFHPLSSSSPENHYSSIWSEEMLVPTVVALAKICGGDIRLSVARGRKGTGTEVIAKPHPGGRMVACCWPKLGSEEGDIAGRWCVPREWGE